MADSRKSLVLALMVVAALLVPSMASAAAVIPPGNSAVNQYTQTIPTSRGNKEVRQNGHHSPSQAIGHKATKKLQKQGKDGTAAAQLAAAGTPANAGGGGSSGGGGSNGGGGGGGSTANGSDGAGAAGAQGSSGIAGSQALADADEGKSGFGQVLGEVTGTSSDGDLGLLLPLAIIAACVWCAAYFWRHRRTAT